MDGSDTAAPSPENTDAALIVYVLYFIGFFVPIAALAGVIVAYVKRAESGPMVQSHLTFQIRTFWIGLAAVVVSIPLYFVLVGFALAILWVVWTLVRCITGLLKLNEHKPVATPESWGFVA